ncbi:MAG: discoidin domain-containing protein, partial [Bacteroidaceae bacterium]|nr:discoidin domain-containing protein [Bacteroidaceae bacterium]
MRKILLLTASLFLTIGAMAQTPIQSGQFDANKLYRIYNQKQESGAGNNDAGYMAISVNDAKTQGVMKAYDANDESQIWKFVADGDNKYKLLNVLTGKYLGDVGPSRIPNMVDEASAASYGMVVNSENKFSFWHTSNAHSSNEEKGRWLWNDGGGKLCGWYAEENPWHLFNLEEVVVVDKTKLHELISQAEDLLDVVATKIKADAEIDLNGKISSNADQNAGGGGRDGDGVGALLDSDPSTYLHTRWGGTVVNEDHYIQIDLGENGNLSDFVFEYATRKTNWESVSPAPTRIEVRVSNDGNNFGEPIAVYTKSGDGLPAKEDAGTTLWQSNVISTDNAVRYIRFTVTESEGRWGIEYGGHYFFAMGTFNLY